MSKKTRNIVSSKYNTKSCNYYAYERAHEYDHL